MPTRDQGILLEKIRIQTRESNTLVNISQKRLEKERKKKENERRKESRLEREATKKDKVYLLFPSGLADAKAKSANKINFMVVQFSKN